MYHHAPGSQFILARNAVTTCKGFFLVQSCMIVGFWGSDALLIVGYLLHVTVKPFFLFACTSTRPLYVAICHIYNILYIYIILQGHFSDANPKWKIRNYMQTMCKRSMSHTYTHLLYGPNLHPTKFCCLCRHKGHVETSHKPSKHKSLTMHTLHFMMCSMLMISNNDDVEKRILRKPQHLERRWAAQNMCRWSDSP